METSAIELLMNYGAMGVTLIWFMWKNNKDMETFKNTIQAENQLTRETLNDLKVVIAKLGGIKDE